MEKQITLFLEFLQNDKKLSDNTLQSYKRDIMQYHNYVDENSINYLKADENKIKDMKANLSKMCIKDSATQIVDIIGRIVGDKNE